MTLRNVSNLVRGFQLLGFGGEPQQTEDEQQQQQQQQQVPASPEDQELYLMAAQRAKQWLRVSGLYIEVG